MGDQAIAIQCQFGAPENGCAWRFSKDHGHFPFHEDHWRFMNHRGQIHMKLLAPFGQPVAHLNKRFLAFHPLDAILKDDILVIVGKDMCPIGFTLLVVGARPEVKDQLGGKRGAGLGAFCGHRFESFIDPGIFLLNH
jgi:hypothetical protein